MTDYRRYTGTQRLQLGVTLAAAVAVGLAVGPLRSLAFGFVSPALFVAIMSGVWLIGLVGLGLRDRTQWNRLVSASSFESQRGTRTVDLEKIIDGRSVTGTTNVPSIFAQTHLEIRTDIEEVEANFTVTMEQVGSGGKSRGITTGTDQLDEAFVIEGSPDNVGRILSPDVQIALMEIMTPGTCTVTGEAVVYDVPFTTVQPGELEAVADAIVEIAQRVEAVGQTR